jgi:hypothetical protein
MIGKAFSWGADRLLLAGAARQGTHLGSALGWTGLGLARGAAMNPYLRSAGLGAVAGGTYGAFSDNTSVLGGALGGAALGYGGRMGFQAAKIASRLGSAGAGARLSAMGRYAKGHIGNTLDRACNPIKSTLKGRAATRAYRPPSRDSPTYGWWRQGIPQFSNG